MMTGYAGTYRDNKRQVITTAPDALVYINGELSIPSGSNPNKRINIQPYVTSISTSAGVDQTPGTASLSLHIPTHVEQDFFRGGQLILTNMMEVKIYMKGHFLVGGAPRYYPVFWGIVTSVSHTWSGGERNVGLACQDILYWWSIQRIVTNASYMGKDVPSQGAMNTKGNGVFTGLNPYDVIFSLAKHAYGDAVLSEFYTDARQVRSEPNAGDQQRLMWYWTQQWGRIGYALRMYGPRGDLLEGELLGAVVSETNRLSELYGSLTAGKKSRSQLFKLGDVKLNEVAAFSEVLSRIGAIDIFTSEHITKLEAAQTAKDTIGYEFFLDTNGEIVFKPPFYNLDVQPNKPVSWIRPIDIISEDFAENVPDITFLEGTGTLIRNLEVGAEEIVKPKATYVDYRLVQKYGWRPGTYNSEFFGSGLGGDAPRNLFYHLVDQLDRENSRIHTGSVSIPLRPELRLGYPVYYEDQDAFYYVDSINHQFSYSGQCTSSLTLMAKRSKFYGAFPTWDGREPGNNPILQPDEFQSGDVQDNQPAPGEVADPGVYPNNLNRRPISAVSGHPVPDRNVVLKAVDKGQINRPDPTNETFDEIEGEQALPEQVAGQIISFRNQFRVYGNNDFVYVVDEKRDEPLRYSENGQKIGGPITSIQVERQTVGGETRILPILPVSDEKGYEVIGGFEYGRTVRLTQRGLDFRRQTGGRAAELARLKPSSVAEGGAESIEEEGFASNQSLSDEDRVATLDPNNYGFRLLEVRPISPETMPYVEDARQIVVTRPFTPPAPGQSIAGIPASTRTFRRTAQVAQWQEKGALEEARASLGLSAEQYPDAVLLAFLHTESSGRADARRTNENGKLSEYCGPLQIGKNNAAEFGRSNTDFLGTGPNDRGAVVRSLAHFLQFQEKYADRHNYDSDRMAILWKGGPGTLRRFNELEKTNPSAAVGYLSEQYGTDQYVAIKRQAQAVWADSQAPTVPVTTEELQDPSGINTVALRPEEGDFAESEASNQLFGRLLADNLEAGLGTLPSSFQPIRDPGVIPYINSFIRELYRVGVESEDALERELRGEVRRARNDKLGEDE